MSSSIDLITKIIENLWSQVLEGNTKTTFLNLTSTDIINDIVSKLIKKHSSKAKSYSFNILDNEALPPFFPYLELIKHYISENSPIDIDNFLQESAVYYFQREVFSKYLKGLPTSRYEEVLFEELDYEIYEFNHSIYKIMTKISSNRPLIVVINNFQFAKESTLNLTKFIIDKAFNAKILFIFTLNKNFHYLSEEKNQQWYDFLNYIDSKQLLLDFSLEYVPIMQSTITTYKPNTIEELEKLINTSRDCFYFLNLKECKEYILEAYNYKIQQNIILSEEDYTYMLRLLGDVYTFLDDYDNALIFYNILLSHGQSKNNLKLISDVLRKMGFIYLKKDDVDTAERLGNQSLKIANSINDKLQSFYAYLLLFLTEDKGRSRSLAQWRETYQVLIQLSKDLKMINTLAYYCTNPYGLYTQYTHENEILHNYGIKLAKQYRNTYRLATAYQTKALVNSIQGKYNEVLDYYIKSKNLKEKLDNKLELAHSYNGLGFYHYLRGEYLLAQENYEKALQCLKIVRNQHEIAMTFYNIAVNYYFAFRNDLALIYLNKLLSLMSILKLKGLKYHSNYGIYSLMGVVHASSGDISKAYEYLSRIKFQNLKPQPQKNEEYFLFELLQALIYKSEKRYDKADKQFQQALVYLNKKNDVIIYMAPRFYYEYGLLYKEMNNYQGALELFNEGIKICEELHYTFYKDILLNQIYGEDHTVPKLNFSDKTFDFDWTMEAAQLEMNLTKLHKRITEINFLNNLQSIITKASVKQKLIDSVMELINSYFYVEISGIYLSEDATLNCFNINKKITDFNIECLLNALIKNNSDKALININSDDKYKDFSPYLSYIAYIPLISNSTLIGCMFLANKKEEIPISYNELQILSIACKQLTIALEKIKKETEILIKNEELHKANEELLKAATTDSLTKVNNRQALYKRLKEEKDKSHSNKCESSSLVILFIDLDNLKYYNDNFGHLIGDLILINFAEILRANSSKEDFIARYGGDEFVMICPGKTQDEAATLSAKIQDAITNKNGFKEEIEKILNSKIDIPANKKISCSIGICEYNPNSSITVDNLIKLADNAMYKAKHSGKNQFAIWSK
ncbi:Bacteriophytochrome cph2 [Clostridium sp. N3C]|uniref:diguanylate cyclase n=1 Tax=Clostridium sp. N3C TaxID=1776758 RepID=UPI00092DF7BB|nr:diguanylate cyclase [Clostridium sp. N3C]SCN25689.1 Bacteriophytochrome cph2 [Clostridium sp. N3C]